MLLALHPGALLLREGKGNGPRELLPCWGPGGEASGMGHIGLCVVPGLHPMMLLHFKDA